MVRAVFVAVLRQFQDYVRPSDEGATRHSVTSADTVAAASSLGDDTLTVNLGIPIVVVLTKVCSVNITSVIMTGLRWLTAACVCLSVVNCVCHTDVICSL